MAEAQAKPVARAYVFYVDAAGEKDAFLRVLAPFAQTDATLTSASLASEAGRTAIRIETAGLDDQAADRLLRRLRGLPVVTGVGLAWRSR